MLKEEIQKEPLNSMENVLPDHFKKTPTATFAGTHLLVDIWEAQGLDDMARIENTLEEAVKISKATLIHIHLHRFTPSGGISGIAILAESHMSIHTWPERGYAAVDLFMCGNTEPELAVPILKKAFRPSRVEVNTVHRGQVR
ncbi:MAG: adenosylmethionine decarboxylase [Rhodospirillaceae bacterium]|nr:adenosylmethionine decarboxylase [Rhodospirillaceae bacterium]